VTIQKKTTTWQYNHHLTPHYQVTNTHQKYIEFIEISLIRAIFGIEREFDRYYLRLKQ
jgi:hypothetical protein